jgi:WXG100 family type VII secretion target
MARLRAEYDAIQQAMNRISGMNGDAQGALSTLTGAVTDMMDGNWEGLAAQVFMGWFQDIATKRANEIIEEFTSLEQKLQRIMQMIQEADQDAANLFNQG